MKLRSKKEVIFKDFIKKPVPRKTILKTRIRLVSAKRMSQLPVYGPENNPEFIDEEETTYRMSDFVRKPDPLQVEGNLAENWRKFKRNFDIYMEASELKAKGDAVKINVFLNIIGGDAVEIYDTLKLETAQRNSYVAVIKAFDDFCKPKTNPVYERFVFSQRVQKEGETFDAFHVDIKRLVKTCGFAEKEDEMLRYRIVIGVSNKNLQKRSLELADLTYATAVEKCKASEATHGQLEEMNKTIATVNEVRQNNGTHGNNGMNGKKQSTTQRRHKNEYHRARGQQQQHTQQSNNKMARQQNGKMSNDSKNSDWNLLTCKFCNYKHKFGSNFCPAYGKECGNCKRMNHFQAVCRVKHVQSLNANDFDEISNMYVHSLTQISECSANAANVVSKPVWREDVRINDKVVSFKVDTGSDVTTLPKRLLDLVAPGCSMNQSQTILQAFGGNTVRPIGNNVFNCSLNGMTRKIKIEIVDFETVPLLGLDACIAFGLIDIRKITNRRVNFLGI